MQADVVRRLAELAHHAHEDRADIAAGGGERLALGGELGRQRRDIGGQLAEQRLQRGAAIATDLAEEQIERLDVGRALVERVDLLVAQVLLDRIVRAVARAAEALQAHAEQLEDFLRRVALAQRQEQIVASVEGLRGLGAVTAGELDAILDVGGVEDQRAQPLGERLLQHQHAADVGVADDLDARRGLVGGAREVGALLAQPGVRQRVAVRGRQRGHRLGGDAHARVLDDVEHLRDAVAHAADEQTAARRGGAEGQLAGRRGLDAELVLDVGDHRAVARAERAVGLDPELGHQEHAEALGAGRRALGAGQHQVHDVLGLIEVTVGDEPLHALDQVLVALDVDRLGGAGADVAAGVGLGQDHRAAPVAVEDVAQVARLLILGAELIDHLRVEVAEQVEGERGVGAAQELERRPRHGRRRAVAAQVLGQLELVPAVAVVRLERRGEARRQGHVAGAVELEADAITFREARREVLVGELGQALERRPRAVGVERGERPLAEDAAIDREHLEQVEEDVAQVGLVVAGRGHRARSLPDTREPRNTTASEGASVRGDHGGSTFRVGPPRMCPSGKV